QPPSPPLFPYTTLFRSSGLSIPAWAFGHSLSTLVAGSFLMQTGVQGAFGVIPAHLNELSPDPVRGLFPGFVYQLGVLVSSPAVRSEEHTSELQSPCNLV